MNRLTQLFLVPLLFAGGLVSSPVRSEDDVEDNSGETDHEQKNEAKEPTHEQMVEFLKCYPELKELWNKSAPVAKEQRECLASTKKALAEATSLKKKYAVTLPTCYTFVLFRKNHLLVHDILTDGFYKVWPADKGHKQGPFSGEKTFALLIERAEKDRFAADVDRRIKLDAERDAESKRMFEDAWGCKMPASE